MTLLQELQAGVLAEVAELSDVAVRTRRLKAIQDARDAKVTMREIADALGYTRPTLYEWIKTARKQAPA